MFMPEGVAEQYIRAFGTERMVYGSDYPLWDPVEEVQRFFKLKLTDGEFEQIAHKTAENFLNL
jgi:predicted TIM-barrel fold metal-dependent hydrolase